MRFNLDNYETVEARLAKFWEMYPNGRVSTNIHHYDENKVVFRAEVYKDISDPIPVATGYAEEIRDASPVNRTSHVENAETSAIGRALANFVFQSKTAPRPSREEMTKVVRQQEPKPDADLLTKFRAACSKAGLDPQDVAKAAGVDLYELTDESMPKLRNAFKAMQQPAPVTVEQVKEAFGAQVQVVAQDAKTDKPHPKNPGEPATKAQIGKIRAMLSAKGVQSFTEKTEVCADLINRPITKMEQLTQGEASQVIGILDVEAK